MTKPWLSKTLITNALIAVLAVAYPPASQFIASHPTEVAVGFSLLNMLLRLVTKNAIGLSDA